MLSQIGFLGYRIIHARHLLGSSFRTETCGSEKIRRICVRKTLSSDGVPANAWMIPGEIWKLRWEQDLSW
jgi:hypothetical protein